MSISETGWGRCYCIAIDVHRELGLQETPIFMPLYVTFKLQITQRILEPLTIIPMDTWDIRIKTNRGLDPTLLTDLMFDKETDA